MISARIRGVAIVDGRAVPSTGHPISITVQGHALFAEKGSDIVCAAVSVLVQSFARTLAANGIDLEIGGDPDIMIVRIRDVVTDRDSGNCVRGSVEMLLHGLMMTAESYPDHVEIEFDQMR